MNNSQNSSPRKSKLRLLILTLGVLIGAVGGYLYYIKIGCNSGSCPITSNPWMSIIWGAIMGYLLADLVPVSKKKESKA
ncbi:MAG: DUF6132 family protein [Bacteroidales bacterium]